MNRKDFKLYVRVDGSGRLIPGSSVLRKKMPKVGKWVEVNGYECCNYTTTTTTAVPTTTTTTTAAG